MLKNISKYNEFNYFPRSDIHIEMLVKGKKSEFALKMKNYIKSGERRSVSLSLIQSHALCPSNPPALKPGFINWKKRIIRS